MTTPPEQPSPLEVTQQLIEGFASFITPPSGQATTQRKMVIGHKIVLEVHTGGDLYAKVVSPRSKVHDLAHNPKPGQDIRDSIQTLTGVLCEAVGKWQEARRIENTSSEVDPVDKWREVPEATPEPVSTEKPWPASQHGGVEFLTGGPVSREIMP